jgi:hypothetical protein
VSKFSRCTVSLIGTLVLLGTASLAFADLLTPTGSKVEDGMESANVKGPKHPTTRTKEMKSQSLSQIFSTSPKIFIMSRLGPLRQFS